MNFSRSRIRLISNLLCSHFGDPDESDGDGECICRIPGDKDPDALAYTGSKQERGLAIWMINRNPKNILMAIRARS